MLYYPGCQASYWKDELRARKLRSFNLLPCATLPGRAAWKGFTRQAVRDKKKRFELINTGAIINIPFL